jgi:hypothetical protein
MLEMRQPDIQGRQAAAAAGLTSLHQLLSVDLELLKYCGQHLELRMRVTQWQRLEVDSMVTDSAGNHYLLNSV